MHIMMWSALLTASLAVVIAARLMLRGDAAKIAHLRLECAMLNAKLQIEQTNAARNSEALHGALADINNAIPANFHDYASTPVRVRLLTHAYEELRRAPATVLERQPPPNNRGSPVWPIASQEAKRIFQTHELWEQFRLIMQERDQQGRERYGVPLCAHNGRDACVDALQEALDLCAYLAQIVEEDEKDGDEAHHCLVDALHVTFWLFRKTHG